MLEACVHLGERSSLCERMSLLYARNVRESAREETVSRGRDVRKVEDQMWKAPREPARTVFFVENASP